MPKPKPSTKKIPTDVYQKGIKDATKLIQDLEKIKKEVSETEFTDIKELDKISKRVSRLLIKMGKSPQLAHYPTVSIGVTVILELINSTVAELGKFITKLQLKKNIQKTKEQIAKL